MMSFEMYKVLHIVGVFMVITGLTATGAVCWAGVAKENPARRLAAATHGFGLLIVLIAGFGMLARAQIPVGQSWVVGKLGIWIVLGGMMVLAKRMAARTPMIWLLTFILGGAAAYLAIVKP